MLHFWIGYRSGQWMIEDEDVGHDFGLRSNWLVYGPKVLQNLLSSYFDPYPAKTCSRCLLVCLVYPKIVYFSSRAGRYKQCLQNFIGKSPIGIKIYQWFIKLKKNARGNGNLISKPCKNKCSVERWSLNTQTAISIGKKISEEVAPHIKKNYLKTRNLSVDAPSHQPLPFWGGKTI